MSSLKQKLMKDIEALVDLYIEQVTGGKKEGVKTSKEPKVSREPKVSKEAKEVDLDDLSLSRITSCNVAELKALCKTRGLKLGGKKDELIERLRDYAKGKNGDNEDVEDEKDDKEKEVKKSKGTKKQSSMPEVLKKLASKTTACAVRKNKHGNLEHPGTGMVFENNVVVGVQEDDGNVRSLTDEDIQVCKQQKFPFKLPKNLETDDLDKDDSSDEEKEVEVKPKKGKDPKGEKGEKGNKGTKKDKVDALLEGDVSAEELDPEEIPSEEELEDDIQDE